MSPQRPIGVLFGTRPEAIKLAPVITELRARDVPTLVIATGQHADLVAPVLDLFDRREVRCVDLVQPSSEARKGSNVSVNRRSADAG